MIKTNKQRNAITRRLLGLIHVVYLIKVVQRSVQIGQHACGWLVSDLDGIFQNSLWNDVFLWSGGGFCTHEHSVVLVTVLTATFKKLLQTSQPLCNQMNVLEEMHAFA